MREKILKEKGLGVEEESYDSNSEVALKICSILM